MELYLQRPIRLHDVQINSVTFALFFKSSPQYVYVLIRFLPHRNTPRLCYEHRAVNTVVKIMIIDSKSRKKQRNRLFMQNVAILLY